MKTHYSAQNKLLSRTILFLMLGLTPSSFFNTVYANDLVTENSKSLQSEKEIRGVIKDTSGNPIIGATVIEKGTTNGAITTPTGEFLLEVKPGAILEASFMGYATKEFAIDTKTLYEITLENDALKMDEVIVVGYGTMKKSDLTGTVVSADLDKIKSSSNVGLAESLQGAISGVNVGAVTSAGGNPSIDIRGRTSISGSSSPLIVLDGIIFRGNMVDINPNDIQSLDVLKDASAAAIYGSEASNGVMIITTKQGTKMSKPVIEYSGTFAIQEITNKDMLPGDTDNFIKVIEDSHLHVSRTGDDLLTPNPDFDPSKYFMDRKSMEGYEAGVNTNWWELLTRDMPYIQTHNISVRGKSELSGYYLSVGLADQKNVIINDDYSRYNVRMNLDTKVTDWLKVGMQSFFSYADYSGVSPSQNSVMSLPSVCPAYDENNELIPQPYKSSTNPLLDIQQENINTRYNLSANFFADVNIPWVKGLNYRVNYSQYLTDGKQFNFDPNAENFQGKGSKTNSEQYQTTLDNILTYKNSFGEHDINATFVYGYEKRKYENTSATASIFTNDILGFNSLESGQTDLQRVASSAWDEASLYMMGRVGYTFKDRYMFTGTIRRDGFSGFGENNKFATFPSAAVAWRITKEDFMKDSKWIKDLKLRVSYGQNGNRTVGRYQTLSQISSGSGYLYGDGGTPELKQWISSLSNADLKWETTNTFNAGVDFSLLDGAISGNIEYYVSNTHDMLYNISIPYLNGFNSIASNIGEMGNKGQEITIHATPIARGDFQWNLTGNFSRNRNKVKSILGIDADGDGKEDDLVSSKIFMNEPYGVKYDYNITGMWQIDDYVNGIAPDGFLYGTYKIEDINEDGKYTASDDRKIIGYADPSYSFSIQSNMSYKGFEFSFMINSIQGGSKYYLGQPGSGLDNPDNIFQNNMFKFDYWTPENPDARYRQLGSYYEAIGYGFSPYVSRSFVRLQDATLAYNVSTSWLKKANINRARVFVTGKNLLTFTDWDGWDPQTGAGLTKWNAPLLRSYTVGLNFEF